MLSGQVEEVGAGGVDAMVALLALLLEQGLEEVEARGRAVGHADGDREVEGHRG